MFVMILALGLACPQEADAHPETTDPPGQVAAEGAAKPGPGDECTNPPTPPEDPPALAAGDHTLALDFGGRRRTAVLHVPAKRAPGPSALVVVLHGGGGNAKNAEQMTRFSECADREGFLCLYPNGTGRLKNILLTWNSGGIPVYAADQQVDDVGFLRALVADVGRMTELDRGRVFATGMSNGGMMVHRLAREAADVFVAVADVSGAMNFTACDPAQPVSVLMIHGRADEHVLYSGGRPRVAVGRAGEREDTPVATAITYYADQLGLEGPPATSTEGKVTTETWADPDRPGVGVVLVSIDDEGHTWPGGPGSGRRRGDKATAEFDATAAIWRFFRDHPRALTGAAADPDDPPSQGPSRRGLGAGR